MFYSLYITCLSAHAFQKITLIRAVSTHAVTLRYSSGTATANVPALLTLESDGGELEQITFKVEEILSTETSTATKRDGLMVNVPKIPPPHPQKREECACTCVISFVATVFVGMRVHVFQWLGACNTMKENRGEKLLTKSGLILPIHIQNTHSNDHFFVLFCFVLFFFRPYRCTLTKVSVVHTHAWYRGSVVGDPSGSVRIGGRRGQFGADAPSSNASRLMLTGIVHAYGSSWTLTASANPSIGGELTLTETSNVRATTATPTFTADSYADHRDEGKLKQHAAHRLVADNAGHDGCAEQPVHEDPADHPHRHRRESSPSSNQHTECKIFADADPLFFDKWKGECMPSWSADYCEEQQLNRVTVKMMSM